MNGNGPKLTGKKKRMARRSLGVWDREVGVENVQRLSIMLALEKPDRYIRSLRKTCKSWLTRYVDKVEMRKVPVSLDKYTLAQDTLAPV